LIRHNQRGDENVHNFETSRTTRTSPLPADRQNSAEGS
jgi:hypothetical protein